MQKFGLLFYIFSFTMATTARAQHDSLEQHSVLSLQQQQLYQWYKQQSAALLVNPIQHYTTVGLSWQQETGEYRRVQQAEKVRSASFAAEGLQKVKNIWVQGTFSYQRRWEDRIRYNMRRDINDLSPYYYFAPRTGNMNYEIYHLDGQVAAPVLHHKWVVGGGVSYDASTNSRTIDPRPVGRYFNLDGKASVSYYITPKQFISIEPRFGYSREMVSYFNKNTDSASTAAYQVYRAEGLVEVSSSSETKSEMQQWRYFHGINAGYYLNTIAAGYWWARYQYLQTNEKTFYRNYNPLVMALYSTMHYYQNQVAAGWYKTFRRVTTSASWSTQVIKASDFNTYLDGSNFTLYNIQHTATAMLSLNSNNRPVHEWGLSWQSRQQQQKDGNHTAKADYKRNLYALQYRWNIYGKKNIVQVTANGGLSVNNNSSLQLSTASKENLFVKAVVYPDAQYASTSNWQGGLKLAYIQNATATLRWAIEGGMQYQRSYQQDLFYTTSGFTPGKDRVAWTAGLRFFL
ncbi:hypothetical protein SAMN05421788_106345 [Filimonas lacunae]|uniref:DUF6850 domain-containing protein n=1 Tax=Filimonas lacunae TaxID=477680 RepID=A0A173MFL6_9BACT|nr:DUF6850 family outer membrane beta-barrel protein [Filimonas lacunae]BAV06279.1 hypothetical protein FLA_2295 [Filimonas lacunae]SIT25622.1 hypothetical protein SAMN05421788_106345 [Filimonas lacunae]